MRSVSFVKYLNFIAVCTSAVLITACGNGTTYQPFEAKSIIALGDSLLYAADDVHSCDNATGRTGRYTVNLGCEKNANGDFEHTFNNNIIYQLADRYGIDYKSQPALVKNYAQGNALLDDTFKAGAKKYFAEVDNTPSLKQQIEQLLADKQAGEITFDEQQLILLSAGTADIISQTRQVEDGKINESQAINNVQQLAASYIEQIKKLSAAGAKHITFLSPYQLQASLWGRETETRSNLLETLTTANDGRSFNEHTGLLANKNLGQNVFWFPLSDTIASNFGDEFFYNDKMLCSDKAVDENEGIGLGKGQINSKLCSMETLAADVDLNNWRYFFSDKIYPSPVILRWLADQIYDKGRDKIWN